MIPKQPRQKDTKYLDFIRGKPCLCNGGSCIGEVTSHHTVSRGAWGSDYRTIPICAFHHLEMEQRSLSFMENIYHFSALDEIIKLLCEYLGRRE